MAEYIDREAFLEHMKRTDRYFDVKFDIENFPAADVAPVVRCRECKWAKHDILLCKYTCTRGLLIEVREDDFCSYGERRTDNV